MDNLDKDDAASEHLAATAEDLAGALVLDVRRTAAFEQADSMIPGAQWRDPAQLGSWSGQLPRDKLVVVYCVHGHQVSRGAAMQLQAAGIDARFLRGGIEDWKAAGRPLAPKNS